MYLHVGNGINIRSKNIIGIFDTDNATVSITTRKFLREYENAGKVSSAVYEIPKSFVLYEDGEGGSEVCFSQLSSASLSGRIKNREFE